MTPVDKSLHEAAALRRLLTDELPTDVEFEAFCIDCFRSIYSQKFACGMARMQKENLLLQYVSASEIRMQLEQWRNLLNDDTRVRPNDRVLIQKNLARDLQALYAEKEQLLLSGHEPHSAEVTTINTKIAMVRREQRHGPSLHRGEVLADRFVLDQVIGSGGFAVVWRAYDRERCAMVAVKVLHGQWSADTSRIERFQRGAVRMSELQHPGVVRVLFGAQQDAGFHFFVTEYLSGGDLRRALLTRRITKQQAIQALLKVGEAVQFAHDRQFIHRDIKPSNIMLDDNADAKIGDFDLVHVPDSSGGTRTTAIGSVFYAAPEAMENAKSVEQPASDIYSLGMSLAFIIFGKDLPQAAWTDRKAFWRELACSSRMRVVIERATAQKQADRFPSASKFCQALREAQERDGTAASEIRKDLGRWLHTHKVTSLAAGSVLVLCLLFGAMVYLRHQQASWSGYSVTPAPSLQSPTPVGYIENRSPAIREKSIPLGIRENLPLTRSKEKLPTNLPKGVKRARMSHEDENDIPVVDIQH